MYGTHKNWAYSVDQIRHMVKEVAVEEGVPWQLFMSLIEYESRQDRELDYLAVGPSDNEIGLGQLHPKFAWWYLYLFGEDILEDAGFDTGYAACANMRMADIERLLYQPRNNLMVSARYLRWLHGLRWCDGSWMWAMAGYNGGYGVVIGARRGRDGEMMGEESVQNLSAQIRRYLKRTYLKVK